jgi:NAD(P)-dependent dehydrogenase (short-subunit alcohol dehydrogenase family)
MGRIDGKVALVTGGAMGIGAAVCKLLAREGAKVAVADVQARDGEMIAGDICRAKAEAKFWELNVTDEAAVKRVTDEVVARYGSLDILVNNAGIGGVSKPVHEITEAEWDKVMAVNVKGVFFCTKHAVPHMLRAKKGSIVNISSIYGLVGAMDAPPYHASKGAVRLMTKTDALYYAAKGIRVNSLHPGFILTKMVEDAMRAAGDYEQNIAGLTALHPIGFLGDPDDIAYGVLFLASDESRWMTGSELVIDGGYTAR